MTISKDNQEDDQIQKSRIWTGKYMKGKWDGSGIWHEKDNKWSGHGTWQGGLIDGNWNIDNGKWEPVGDGVGTWSGEGAFFCNLPFMPDLKKSVFIIGFISSIVASALSLFVDAYGLNTAIIIVFIIVLLTVLTNYYLNTINNGKLSVKGDWRDEGEYRILDITGDWKLGGYNGVIEGKMKDPKPRDPKID